MLENEKGRAQAFSTFSPFKSWLGRQVQRVVYVGAPDHELDIRERKFLHYAYWLTLTPAALKRAGLAKKDRPKHGALLFVSGFNGRADQYVNAFSEHLHSQMNVLWSQCEEWENAGELDKLNRFIARHRRRADLFFNAYGDDAPRVRAALLLRRRLDALAAEFGHGNSGDDGQLKSELTALAEGGGDA